VSAGELETLRGFCECLYNPRESIFLAVAVCLFSTAQRGELLIPGGRSSILCSAQLSWLRRFSGSREELRSLLLSCSGSMYFPFEEISDTCNALQYRYLNCLEKMKKRVPSESIIPAWTPRGSVCAGGLVPTHSSGTHKFCFSKITNKFHLQRD
jgi:hypothetical protein